MTFRRDQPAVLRVGNDARPAVLPTHHGEQGPRDLCWDDGISHGAAVTAQCRHRRSFYAESIASTASGIWRRMRVATRHSLRVRIRYDSAWQTG